MLRVEVFANDVVKIWIVDKSAMLFAEEHQLGWSCSFYVSKICMQEDEADEHEHHVVVDDPHAHDSANKIRRPSEWSEVCCRAPEAKSSPEHDDDEDRNAEIGYLLRNA